MTIEQKMGERIKSVRIAQDITLDALASSTQIDRAYLSEIENGHKNISIATLGKISAALHISMSELVDHVDQN